MRVYIVSTSDDEPNAVYVFEVWDSEDAHQASLTLESTQNLIKREKPLITGAERISTLNTRGGKGVLGQKNAQSIISLSVFLFIYSASKSTIK
ncbi:putative quinol monooxygenase [Bacillus sp. R86525]|uniref:putative quinol monooxygenase n=1 Tax=Bacillus sp. R86525 TaxID=3101709 RepID=UPI00366B4719